MESSTPMPGPSNRKRKSALLEFNDSSATPQKRISSLHEADEDEESERSRRRSMASVAERLNETNEHFSKEIIMPHLQLCMKLYSTNKLDSKNIWNFKVIDYLSAMVRDNTFDIDTLKVATSNIEVGAKVYGVRVDCIYTQGMQLVSNMARNFENNADDNDDDEAENADGEAAAAPKPKTRKVKTRKLIEGKEPSILKDISSLLAPIKQLPSVEFSGGQNNSNKYRFMSTSVPMNYDTQFLYMSKEKYDVDYDDLENYEYSSLNEKINTEGLLPDFKSKKMFSTFEDFQITGWDPDNDEKSADESHLLAAADPELLFDKDGHLIAELDGSIHDPFQIEAYLSDNEEEHVVGQMGQPNVEFITDAIIPDDPSTCHEYLYNTIVAADASQLVVNLWAGPSHWKLKAIKHRAPTTFTGSVQSKEDKKKRGKKPTEIEEFTFDVNEIVGSEMQAARRGKRTTKVSRYRVPPRLIESVRPMQTVRNMFIFPLDSMRRQLPAGEAQPQEASNIPADDYNYNNPNDSQFCIDASSAEDNGYDEGLPAGDQEQDLNNETFEMPELVPKSTIGFNKTAKKMNMKKLKAAIWYILADLKPAPEAVPQEKGHIEGEKHFIDMYAKLPKKINKSMAEALSVPLAFSALLHLANENKLMLTGVEQLSDIDIIQLP